MVGRTEEARTGKALESLKMEDKETGKDKESLNNAAFGKEGRSGKETRDKEMT